jgi:hypothetical protein
MAELREQQVLALLCPASFRNVDVFLEENRTPPSSAMNLNGDGSAL